MTPPSPITRSGAQHDAQQELSKAIYHRNNDPLVVRAMRAVGHFIDRLLSDVTSRGTGGSLGALALVVVIVAVAVVIIWRVGLPRRTATVGAVLPSGRTMSAAEHRLRAERAAADADWLTAVVERMRAVALELEERGVVDPRAGRTATELADEVARRLPDAGPSLRTASETFNAVRYGGATPSPSDVAVVVAADDAVVSRSARPVATVG